MFEIVVSTIVFQGLCPSVSRHYISLYKQGLLVCNRECELLESKENESPCNIFHLSTLCAEATTVNNPIPQFGIRLLNVVVDNDLLMRARQLGKSQLVLCLCQSLSQRFLGLGAAATKALLQLLQRRRGEEHEPRVQVGLLDLLHALHLDIQNTDALLLGDVLDGLHGGSVMVSAELGMLDEAVGGNEFEESLLGSEVVFAAVLLTSARLTGCVCYGQSWSCWRGILCSREMEKPNLSGNSLKRRPRRVDLPVPLGPLITTGLN